MNAPRQSLLLVFGMLATLCYAVALVGDLGRTSAPALHRHAGAFSAAGGMFLVVTMWLRWRIRKAKTASHL